MPDELQTLLNYIVAHPLMERESTEAQLDASAVQDVNREISEIDADHRADAERLAPYFARGLRMAAGGSLVVDDTDPLGNSVADAFARFLVTTNLATSRSTPLANSHYRYTFDVDWRRLRSLAEQAGINLDAALANTK
ncbi:MAG: hypothetical protein IVW55_01295 [Chloroflexi bacterium]|nr:hypothetical protein [Chloroflexota bacterium]